MVPLEKLGDSILKGIALELAPSIARGALLEILSRRDVSVATASQWVQSDYSLWDSLEPAEQDSLKKIVKQVKNIDWLTPEWAIDSLRKDYPAVASLFLSWEEAQEWLERQVQTIKEKATE